MPIGFAGGLHDQDIGWVHFGYGGEWYFLQHLGDFEIQLGFF